jgi:rare lipoprotein A
MWLTLHGLVSWYGTYEIGNLTANGERFTGLGHTCASPWLSFNTIIHIFDPQTRRRSWCRVNDRGPYVGTRILDVSPAVRRELGFMGVDKMYLTYRIK